MYNIPVTITFNSFSFGCRVNQAETEVLDRKLADRGLVKTRINPDLFIINTCAVTGKAEREAKQLIYRVKRKLPTTKVAVTGCAATKWIKESVKVEGTDIVIDNPNKDFAADILLKRLKIKRTKKGKTDIINSRYLESGRLLLKIQDGCQRFCTFCIVPYLRGQPKSDSIKKIVGTIRNSDRRVKEVILTAINTQAFGFDTGEKFIDLVRTVIEKTKVARISFGSIHPWSVTEEFLKFYDQILPSKRLADFFHIPLQSGSNKILELMRRGYTREEFTEKLAKIKKINPDAFIGTDIIAGFPDESEADFRDTYNFLRDAPIDKFHVFRFSPREKTAAFYMSKRMKNVPSPLMKKRAAQLGKLSQQKYASFQKSLLGRSFPALFLLEKEDGFRRVLLSNQVPALIETGKDFRAEIKSVLLTEIKKGRLLGILTN